ncbi:Lysophospholipase-like protein 1 [Galemys pyrenaicus]|uniref:palmitoyl-protein hydrolase n=1 Tax=Galemys pyrenaicus TaxID=202257 RepID=A0A8J6AY36_GALPY|nr:Lysophospholipase-like protein 1 [Galemys pyrenaicus]
MAGASGSVHLQRCLVSPAGRHSASLIFLHGSGGLQFFCSGYLQFGTGPAEPAVADHCRPLIPPTKPSILNPLGVHPSQPLLSPKFKQSKLVRPYTPMKGGLSNVWFDRFKISNDVPEHLESIDLMCRILTDLIDDEVKNGIEKNRILVGGFSMGGCMAMHLAYRTHRDVAGVFALSSFLNKASAVYQELQKRDSVLPELFQCHGTADELVLHEWGQETNSMLKSLGVNTKFHSFPGVYHELSKTELEKLKSWILTKLPAELKSQDE